MQRYYGRTLQENVRPVVRRQIDTHRESSVRKVKCATDSAARTQLNETPFLGHCIVTCFVYIMQQACELK